MAKKSMAERIYTAYLTGDEAIFVDENNVTREFTPEGLRDYIESTSEEVSWNDVVNKPETYPFEQTAPIADVAGEENVLNTLNSLLTELRSIGIISVEEEP